MVPEKGLLIGRLRRVDFTRVRPALQHRPLDTSVETDRANSSYGGGLALPRAPVTRRDSGDLINSSVVKRRYPPPPGPTVRLQSSRRRPDTTRYTMTNWRGDRRFVNSDFGKRTVDSILCALPGCVSSGEVRGQLRIAKTTAIDPCHCRLKIANKLRKTNHAASCPRVTGEPSLFDLTVLRLCACKRLPKPRPRNWTQHRVHRIYPKIVDRTSQPWCRLPNHGKKAGIGVLPLERVGCAKKVAFDKETTGTPGGVGACIHKRLASDPVEETHKVLLPESTIMRCQRAEAEVLDHHIRSQEWGEVIQVPSVEYRIKGIGSEWIPFMPLQELRRQFCFEPASHLFGCD